MRPLNHLRVVLILAILIPIAACKKEQPDKPGNQPDAPLNYTLTKSEVLPLETVIVEADGPISFASLTAILSGQDVQLTKVDSNHLAFMCPVLPSGTYALVAHEKFNFDLTVPSYTPPSNPDAIINAFVQDVGEAKTFFSQSGSRPDLSASMSFMETEFNTLKSSLSPGDKELLAYYIVNNGLNSNLAEYFDPGIPDSFMYKAPPTYDPDSAVRNFTARFLVYEFNVIKSLAACTLLLVAPEPTHLTKVLAAGAGLYAAVNMCRLFYLIEVDLDDMMTRAAGMRDEQKKATAFTFTGDPVAFKPKVQFTNFTPADKPLGIFPNLFNGLDKLNNALSGFHKAYKKAAALFSSTPPALNENLLALKSTRKYKEFEINPAKLAVTDISDPGIKVNIISNASGVYLQAVSDYTARTNFTFKVRYTQASINWKVETDFDGVFDPPVSFNMHDTILNGSSHPAIKFNVVAPNSLDWTITHDQPDWMFILPKSGAGKSEVTLSVNNFTSFGNRVATVTFTAGTKVIKAKITQNNDKMIYREFNKTLSSTYSEGDLSQPIQDKDSFVFSFVPQSGEPSFKLNLMVSSTEFFNVNSAYRYGVGTGRLVETDGNKIFAVKAQNVYVSEDNSMTGCTFQMVQQKFADVRYNANEEINSSHFTNHDSDLYHTCYTRIHYYRWNSWYEAPRIGEVSKWQLCQGPYLNHGVPLNTQNMYLPIKVQAGSAYHYGWIRISTGSNASDITVHDMAIHPSPGMPIKTGQK